MSILFYSPWKNNHEWLREIKKKFNKTGIFTLQNKPNLSKIEFAIIWQLPNQILKKIKNVKALFSMGAGVDHILNLSSFNGVPIVRLKDPVLAERITNHVLSQILNYQLCLDNYKNNQNKKKWVDEIEPALNSSLHVGILGFGYLGQFLSKHLKILGYNIIGFKNSKIKTRHSFPVYYKKNDLNKFIKCCDIIINMLPATSKTTNFINKNFLQKMKKKSLIINVGRGSSINENDLIKHLIQNKKFYASLDVFKIEPLPKKNVLWNMPNVIITPHIASITSIKSAVNFMYIQYKKFKKNKNFKGNVDLKKGY